MWEDDEKWEEMAEAQRKRRAVMDKKLRDAVDALPESESGRWLTNVLRAWNAEPGYVDDYALQEARLAIAQLKVLFESDVAILAARVAGVIARVDILDLLHSRLYGRLPQSDWYEEYSAARKKGKVGSTYEEFRNERQNNIRDAGLDWPYAYVRGVDEGSKETIRSYIRTQLERATRLLVEEREASRIDLGIVFVHGIGAQRRGETLQHCGDSLLKWMEGWLRNRRLEWGRCHTHQSWDREPAYLAVRGGQVRGVSDDEPANATVSIPLLRERWLLAEAWWADELHVPSRSAQVAWLLLVTPIAVIAHLSRLWTWRTAKKEESSSNPSFWTDFLGILGAIVAFTLTSVLGTVLALLLQLLVLVTGVVAMFPVKSARALLSLVQATVGDSLQFTESPIGRSAIVNKVRKAIDYAAKRSEQVVVVAHSQGAAVAHRALRVNPPANVKLLATLGAGIEKLETLHAGGRQRILFESLAVSMCVAPLYVVFVATFALRPSSLDLYIILFFVVAYVSAWRLPKRRSDRTDALSLPSIRWADFYARSDPVPNGPIVLGGSDVVDSHMVHNLSSMVRDHTAYWKNRDEFVAMLLRQFSELKLTRLLSAARQNGVVDAMVARRHQRIFWLRLVRASYVMGVLVAIAIGWDALAAVGRDEIAAFLPPLQAWLDDWVVTDALALLGTPEGQSTPRFLSISVDVAYRLIGAVGVLLALAILYLPARWLWGWWNASAMRRFVAPKVGLRKEHAMQPAPGSVWLVFLVITIGIQLTPVILTAWLDPATWLIVVLAIAAAVLGLAAATRLSARLHLGVSLVSQRDHVPTTRFVLPIFALVAGMGWLAVEIGVHGSLFEAYVSLGAGVNRSLISIKQHPILLLPFIYYPILAVAVIRGAIESMTAEAKGESQ